MSPDGAGQQTRENEDANGRNIRHGNRRPLGPSGRWRRALRIDSQNAVIPPSRPTVTYCRRIHPKRALGTDITANLFQLALMKR
jgi:hypothetical protein